MLRNGHRRGLFIVGDGWIAIPLPEQTCAGLMNLWHPRNDSTLSRAPAGAGAGLGNGSIVSNMRFGTTSGAGSSLKSSGELER